ncbi:energy-coupled thiamine transporter ThiT [bacterium]|jgi:thiamine transporter|nr:energy-coupled thiamine transporter ThiT [Gemmatimonadota bacterium]MCH2665662.1 energy-coupled thiamine transporter ThiT [bacterium]HCK10272.1 energy-coupled thiamine transporter ThiT [Candidatus Latescibacterota bacterium]
MSSRLRDLTVVATGAALALVLGIICKALPLPRLPYGGSITLESVPILFVAFWRGWRPGVQTGVLCGLLQLLLDAHIYHPVQVVLDYPLAFGLLGLGAAVGPTVPGILIGCAFRFLAHFLSGVVFFGAYAPEDTTIWAYSALYNATYLIPDAILASFLVPLLLRRVANEKPASPDKTAS